MDARDSEDLQRGFGSGEPGHHVDPADSGEPEDDQDASGVTEIPLGMPVDPQTLAELKRRASEPDPGRVESDQSGDC